MQILKPAQPLIFGFAVLLLYTSTPFDQVSGYIKEKLEENEKIDEAINEMKPNSWAKL